MINCSNGNSNIEYIEVHKIPFGIESPISLGNDLKVDSPYFITEDSILSNVEVSINSLKNNSSKYISNTYMRCVIFYTNNTSRELLYNRYEICIDGESYQEDKYLIDLLSKGNI